MLPLIHDQKLSNYAKSRLFNKLFFNEIQPT